MAVEDIFHVNCQFESPSGHASFGIYYDETAVKSGGASVTTIVATAFNADIAPKIIAVLSAEWMFTSIVVREIDPRNTEKHRFDTVTQVGAVAGQSLPANNALLFTQHQTLYTAKHDNRFFFPGVPETNTLVGVATAAYMSGPVQDLVTALITPIEEISAGTGRWQMGAINQSVLNSAPPAKDWQAAFSVVVELNATPIIATQRRRQTRVVGRSS